MYAAGLLNTAGTRMRLAVWQVHAYLLAKTSLETHCRQEGKQWHRCSACCLSHVSCSHAACMLGWVHCSMGTLQWLCWLNTCIPACQHACMSACLHHTVYTLAAPLHRCTAQSGSHAHHSPVQQLRAHQSVAGGQLRLPAQVDRGLHLTMCNEFDHVQLLYTLAAQLHRALWWQCSLSTAAVRCACAACDNWAPALRASTCSATRIIRPTVLQ